MAPGLGIALLAAPTILCLALAVGLHERASRSPEAARFAPRHRSNRPQVAIAAATLGVFALTDHSRADVLCLVLVLLSLAGSLAVERKLLTTFNDIARLYLNPHHWTSLDERGAHWQYEMQRRFIDDPEHVDGLIVDMLQRYPSYSAFAEAIAQDKFPPAYDRMLDRHYWGRMLPTVRTLAHDVVLGEVFNNRGRFSSGNSEDEIFAELKSLLPGDRNLLMDRWQYYWCLRNLNYIDALMCRVFSTSAFLGVTVGASGVFGLVAGLDRMGYSGWSLVISALAAGALAWLLVVCAGSSLLIVRVFDGTGTFAISYPCRGVDFDRLWGRIIQLGILSFTVSFVIYGIGSPFLLDPAVLVQFELENLFLIYAAGSFLLCALVFAMHTSGIHKLMLESRTNALDRITTSLAAPPTSEHGTELVDHFKDVRALRVWPIRRTTIVQLSAGILLPVTVQVILIYTGLKAR